MFDPKSTQRILFFCGTKKTKDIQINFSIIETNMIQPIKLYFSTNTIECFTYKSNTRKWCPSSGMLAWSLTVRKGKLVAR